MSDKFNELAEELIKLGSKKERGEELSTTEQRRLVELRAQVFEIAGNDPLAREMTEVYQLVDIIKADGAELQPGEASAINMALFRAGKDRLSLFAALKTIQRTHLPLVGHDTE